MAPNMWYSRPTNFFGWWVVELVVAVDRGVWVTTK